VFRVSLPPADVDAPAPRPTSSNPAPGPRRGHILVLDDEERIGATLARVLSLSHDVVTTTDPDDAIARIRRGEVYDVILCDMTMPKKSGIEVHAEIEAISPRAARRMMFLTGGATNARAREFLADQNDRVIEKPFAPSELLERIDAVLRSLGKENDVPR
jgi:DNA-binding response OmpR family regulator